MKKACCAIKFDVQRHDINGLILLTKREVPMKLENIDRVRSTSGRKYSNGLCESDLAENARIHINLMFGCSGR